MRAYFAASVRGKENYVENYEKIVSTLEGLGYSVYSDHVLKNDVKKIDSQTKLDVEKVYKQLNENLKKSDLVVAEVSTPSVSVGHEISEALMMGKPVIMLHVEGGNRAMLLEGVRDERIQTVAYVMANLSKTLKEAVIEAKKNMDVRFNFFVSPKILNYLDYVAKNRMIPRAVFLRDLIEKEMKKDKDFAEQ